MKNRLLALFIIVVLLPASGCDRFRQSKTVRIKGSETIGGRLAKDWANEFNGSHPNTVVTVEAKGTATGFDALIKKECEIAAASRPVSDKEKGGAQATGFDLESPESETVIGFDAIAVIVNRDNAIDYLTVSPQLKDIFSGNVTDWSQVKTDTAQGQGLSGPIKVIIPSDKHGTHAFFKETVLGRDVPFASGAEPHDEITEVASRVAAERNAIGFISLSGIASAKVLQIAATKATQPVAPTEPTIRNQRYPITRRLYLYTRGAPQDAVKEFIDYVLGQSGQALVASNGFVNLTLKSDPGSGGGTEVAGGGGGGKSGDSGAYATLRFRSNSSQIDSLGTGDLQRVVDTYCQQAGSHEIELAGYTDNVGSKEKNYSLSMQRAATVAAELGNKCPQLKVRTSGRGDQDPIADNGTEAGRQLNRRVEVIVK